MISQPNFVQPPHIAVWLVTLFMPVEETESIIGDLFEEFSCVVSKSGVAVAQSWYWRQTVKTIVYLLGSAFRAAPWSTLTIVAGGFLLIKFASQSSAQAMRTFLDTHRIYDWYPDAYLFWVKFPLQIGRVILCTLVGVFISLAAKERELASTVTLALVQMVLFLTAVIAVIASGRDWFHWFLTMMLWNSLCSIATVWGGVIVRTRRSTTATQPLAT